MDSSTHNKIEGTGKEAVGKVAEKVGGKVERKVGDVKKVFGK